MRPQTTIAPLLHAAFDGDARAHDLPDDVIDELTAISQVLPSQQRGDILFDYGTPADRIYIARTGLLKGVVTNSAGERQVTDFYLSGDFLDVQSICTLRHECRLEAVTTTTVVSLPLRGVLTLARANPPLQDALHKAIGRELLKLDHLIYQLCRKPVASRIAAFFLNLSERFRMLGNDPLRFYFPARRADIASMLMMDRATFTRGFRELERRGLIAAEGHEFSLVDPEGLRETALDDELAPREAARQR